MSFTDAEKEELACVYAALLMHDDGIAVTADKIVAATKAAGVKVQPFWPAVFAKTLGGKNIDDLIMNVGAAPAAAPAAAAPAKEEKKDDKKGKKEEPKKEEKKEKEEEEDVDLGFGLFE